MKPALQPPLSRNARIPFLETVPEPSKSKKNFIITAKVALVVFVTIGLVFSSLASGGIAFTAFAVSSGILAKVFSTATGISALISVFFAHSNNMYKYTEKNFSDTLKYFAKTMIPVFYVLYLTGKFLPSFHRHN